MFRVEKKNEILAKKIVNNNSDMSFAGVLCGNNPGEVWVDNLTDPKAAIVFYEGQTGFQFMGEFSEQILKNNLKFFVYNTAKEFLKNKAEYFDFSLDDERWLDVIKGILQDRNIEESTQLVYKLEDNAFIDELEVNDNGKQIDSKFIYAIKNGDVTNPEFLLDYLKTWWGTVDNYLEKGHGFAAVEDGKIVSFAISSSAYGNIQAVGVETLKDYRRKGLAASLIKSLLKLFKEKDIIPWWDCWENNIASQKTAQKNGLELYYKYRVCTIKY